MTYPPEIVDWRLLTIVICHEFPMETSRPNRCRTWSWIPGHCCVSCDIAPAGMPGSWVFGPGDGGEATSLGNPFQGHYLSGSTHDLTSRSWDFQVPGWVTRGLDSWLDFGGPEPGGVWMLFPGLEYPKLDEWKEMEEKYFVPLRPGGSDQAQGACWALDYLS